MCGLSRKLREILGFGNIIGVRTFAGMHVYPNIYVTMYKPINDFRTCLELRFTGKKNAGPFDRNPDGTYLRRSLRDAELWAPFGFCYEAHSRTALENPEGFVDPYTLSEIT